MAEPEFLAELRNVRDAIEEASRQSGDATLAILERLEQIAAELLGHIRPGR